MVIREQGSYFLFGICQLEVDGVQSAVVYDFEGIRIGVYKEAEKVVLGERNLECGFEEGGLVLVD